MSSEVATRIRDKLGEVRGYFTRDIWETRLDALPRRRALQVRSARISFSVLRTLFFEETLHVRAAALTYFTVLSLVPLLAFAFSLLKGFGAYDMLVQETIRPFVLTVLSGNPPLRQAFEQILGFVDQTGVTSLGMIGLLTLLYAATRLLRNIEGALNEIWSVASAREPLQQLRDYIAIIVVTPLCLLAAAALTTVGQALDLIRAAGETLGLRGFLDATLELLGPLLVVFLGLIYLYVVMPNTRVRLRSAIMGALIGGLLWYLVLIAHVRFQVGVARYNALYSGFGAVPIFLVWLQISWLMVLVGAQIAATHQRVRVLGDRMRMARVDQALKEALGVSAMLRVARAFVAGTARPARSQLATECDAPEALMGELLERLERAGLIAATGSNGDPAYVLGRPPERIHVKDVLDALRRSSEPSVDELTHGEGPEAQAAALWLELDASLARAPENRTLHALLETSESEAPRERT